MYHCFLVTVFLDGSQNYFDDKDVKEDIDCDETDDSEHLTCLLARMHCLEERVQEG